MSDALRHDLVGHGDRDAELGCDLPQLEAADAMHLHRAPRALRQLGQRFLQQPQFLPGGTGCFGGRVLVGLHVEGRSRGLSVGDDGPFTGQPTAAIDREIAYDAVKKAKRLVERLYRACRAEAQPGLLHHVLCPGPVTDDGIGVIHQLAAMGQIERQYAAVVSCPAHPSALLPSCKCE